MYLLFQHLNSPQKSMQIVSVCMPFYPAIYQDSKAVRPPPQNSAKIKNLGGGRADNQWGMPH